MPLYPCDKGVFCAKTCRYLVDRLCKKYKFKKVEKSLKKSVDKCGCKCYYIQALSLRGQEMNPKREKAPDFEN